MEGIENRREDGGLEKAKEEILAQKQALESFIAQYGSKIHLLDHYDHGIEMLDEPQELLRQLLDDDVVDGLVEKLKKENVDLGRLEDELYAEVRGPYEMVKKSFRNTLAPIVELSEKYVPRVGKDPNAITNTEEWKAFDRVYTAFMNEHMHNSTFSKIVGV